MIQDIDYKYAYALLKKLNDLQWGDKKVCNKFIYRGYNLWHFYQQSIFEEFKIFSQTKKYTPLPSRSVLSYIKETLMGAAVIVFSAIACLWLIVRRTRVLVYSIDRTNSAYQSDFRLQELYRVLHEQKIVYLEVFHTVLGRNVLIHLWKRGRIALYLEAVSALFRFASSLGLVRQTELDPVKAVDLSVFGTEDERNFVRQLLIRYARQTVLSRWKIFFFTGLFKSTALTTLFAIDDVRYYSEIIVACQFAGVRSYALQHGHFTKYHVGWLREPQFEGNSAVPDALLVWSPYWKQELLRLGTHFPAEKIRIGGVKELSPSSVMNVVATDNTTILIPYETSCPKNEVARYIHALLACPGTRVIFKVRPDIPAAVQLAEYGLTLPVSPQFTVAISLKDVMDQVDIVAGVYSTLLYETIAYGKRVMLFSTISDYGEAMVANGLADMLSFEAGPIPEQLARVKALPTATLEQRRKKLFGEKEILLRDTLTEIVRHEHLA